MNYKKSVWWLVFAIIVGIISVLMIGITIPIALSWGNSSGIFAYFGFIFFSIVFGLLFNFLLDKYHDNINFRLKGSSIVTTICGIFLILSVKTINYLVDTTREMMADQLVSGADMGSMMGNVYVNEIVSIIIIVLCFNLSNVIMIINSKKYNKLLKLLIPIVLGIGIGFVSLYYVSSRFWPVA